MSQKQIDFGSFPNDPSADAIRTAFQKVQDNFTELFNAQSTNGVESVNRTPGDGITLVSPQPTGNVVLSAKIAQVRLQTTTLSLSAGSGASGNSAAIDDGSVPLNINLPANVSGISNLTLTGTLIANTANINLQINGNTAVFSGNISAGNISTTGRLTAGNVTVTTNVNAGNGVFTSNVSAVGFTGGNITLTGKITAAQLQGAGGNISNIQAGNISGTVANATYAISAGSATTATSATTAGTVTTAAQPNITSVGTLTSLAITGNVSAGNANLGNLTTSNFFSGNGSLLTSITGANITGWAPNANVANYAVTTLASTGTYYITFANATTGNLASFANANVNVTMATGTLNATRLSGSLTTAAQPNITSVGTLTSLTVSANITSGNANLGNLTISNFFSGNGSLLSSISAANITGSLPNAVSNAITNVGAITSGTWNSLIGSSATFAAGLSGANLGSITGANITGWAPNANVANLSVTALTSTGTYYLPLITSTTGNLALFANANVNVSVATGTLNATRLSGSLTTAAQPNITSVSGSFGNLVFGTNNSITLSGTTSNITGANLVSANYFQGDGSLLTNISVSAGTSIINGTSNVNVQLNGNVITSVAGVANVLVVTSTGANITGTANVSGNISASNVIGTLYGNIASSNAAQPNITSLGTLTSLTVNGVSNLGSNANVKITGGSSNYFLRTDGAGNLSWINATSLTTAPGLDTQVIFNDNSSFGAQPGLTFDKTTNTLSVSSVVIAPTISATTGYTGNGAGLANITGANVTGTLSTGVQGNITRLGTITTPVIINANVNAANLTVTGTVSGSLLTGTVTTAAQPNITSVGTLTSLNTAGDIIASTVTGRVKTSTDTGGSLSLGLISGAATSTPYIDFNTSLTPVDFDVRLVASGNASTIGGGNLDITAANVNASGNMKVATGIISPNITANTGIFSGNGFGLTNIQSSSISGTVANANVATYIYTTTQSTGNAFFHLVNAATGYVSPTANANVNVNVSTGTINALTFNGNLSGSGNSNVVNLGISNQLVSSVVTGTAPFSVVSTTRVSNLNVSYANVSDYGVVTGQSTGTYYPVLINGSTTGNFALASNGAFSVDLATGTASATKFSGNGNPLTNINAANVTGTLPSAVLGSSSLYVGTTQIALNRASANLALTGITSVSGLANISVSGNSYFATSSGRVGIGTSSPVYKVDIIADNAADGILRVATLSNSATNVSALQISTGDGTVINRNVAALGVIPGESIMRIMVASNAGASAANFNALTRMVIDVNGNVGIGTTTPSTKLHIVASNATASLNGIKLEYNGSTQNNSAPLILATNVSTVNQRQIWIYNSVNDASNVSGQFNIGQFTDSGGFVQSLSAYNMTGNYWTFSTAGSERLRIDSSGRVGIGTSSPTMRLDVVGGTLTPNTQASYALSISGSTGTQQDLTMSSDGTYAYIQSWNSKPLQINGQGNSTLLNLTGGNVSIGTSDVTAKLNVSGGSLGTTAGNLLEISRLQGTTSNNTILALRLVRNANGVDWTTASTRLQSIVDVTNQAYVDFNPSGNKGGFAVGTGNGTVTQALLIDQTGNMNLGGSNATSAAGVRYLDVANYENTSGTSAVDLRLITRNTASSGTSAVEFIKYKSGAFLLNNAETDSSAYVAFGVNGEKVRITSAGNLGVGTTSPVAKIHAYGTIPNIRAQDVTGFVEMYTNAGTSTLSNSGSGALVFANNGAERMRIDGAGNVGIGTNSPTVPVDIIGSANGVSSAIRSYNSNAGSSASVSYQQQTTNVTSIQVTNQTQSIIGTTTAHPQVFLTGNTERVRITATGNVGIGTSSPSTLLQVSGTVTATSFSGAGTGLTGTASSLTAGNATIAATANALNTGNNYTVAGITGVTAGSLPSGDFSTPNDSTTGGIRVRGNATSGNAIIQFTNSAASAEWSNMTVTSTGSMTYSGSITAVGNITAFSDARLKTDLIRIDSALDKINTLTGYTFTRTDSGERQTGLIAQEVQAILPEAVVDGEYLSVAYGNMTGLLVEAIKEQQGIISAQNVKINSLEEKLNLLLSKLEEK